MRTVRLWIADQHLREGVRTSSPEAGLVAAADDGANVAVLPPDHCTSDALAPLPPGALVQLVTSGLDALPPSARSRRDLAWASAKDAFADPVAEHALMLTLAALRDVKRDARAARWGVSHGSSLLGCRVTVVGAGAIAQSLARLMQPFRVQLTVVRAREEPVSWAHRTTRDLVSGVRDAEVVVLALPLTGATHKLVDAFVLSRLAPSAVIVNVSRGGVIDTEALVSALDAGHLGFAALDVVDPEPLPPQHPLWDHPHALITPHTANPPTMAHERLVELVVDNARRWAAGEPIRNRFDPAAGY